MLPYFIFLVISLQLAYWAFREQRPKYPYLILLLAFLSLFAGLRNIQVGTDTGGYARGFEDAFYLEKELERGIAALTDEPGFYYLQKWLGSLSNEYYVLLTGIALVFSLFVILSIGRHSKMPVFSFLLHSVTILLFSMRLDKELQWPSTCCLYHI